MYRPLVIHDDYVISEGDLIERTETLIFIPPMTMLTPAFGNLDDLVNEGLESFSAELSNPTDGLQVEEPSLATVDIVDDDGKCVFLVNIIL